MSRGGRMCCSFRNDSSVTTRRHGDVRIGILLSMTLLIIRIDVCDAVFNKAVLASKLFNNYTKELRPQCNGTDIITVSLDVALRQIMELDEAKQQVSTNIWFRMSWVDSHFSWRPEDFDGVKHVVVYSTLIWVPDITLYQNSVADGLMKYMREFRAVIYYNGVVILNFPHVVNSVCPVDVTYFPFDTQKCSFTLGSWAYNGFEVDVVNTREIGDASAYISNGEWELTQITASKHTSYFLCCPEPFPGVTFVVHLNRMPLFYMFNLVFPCLLISCISMLSFCLPPDSGEKVSLGITVLLSLTVFLWIVSESMPATSETIPLIGQYFAATIVLVSLSCLMTVTVLNVHFRGNNGRQVPKWIRKLILEFLGKLLCVSPTIPGHINSKGRRYGETLCDPNAVWSTYANGTRGQAYISITTNANSLMEGRTASSGVDDRSNGNCHGVGDNQELHKLPRDSGQHDTVVNTFGNDIEDSDREDLLIKEWRQVAFVMDRLFLVLYVSFAVITPTAIFLRAMGK